MKRKMLISTLAICLVMLMAFPMIASAATVRLAYAGGSLKIRSGAGTNYGVNGYVYNGTTVTVLNKGPVWSNIRTSGGVTGYIKNLYIDDGTANFAAGTTYYSGGISGTVKTVYASSTVNMRSGASTSTSSMAKLSNGTKVTVLGENGNWYLIKTSGGTQGYMSKSYIKTGSSSTTYTTAKVTGYSVNMRSGAGVGYSIIDVLDKNDTVSVVSKGSSWSKVTFGGRTGWMSNRYLKFN